MTAYVSKPVDVKMFPYPQRHSTDFMISFPEFDFSTLAGKLLVLKIYNLWPSSISSLSTSGSLCYVLSFQFII